MNDKKIGFWSLSAIGIGSIIGSGWLFAAYYLSRDVGTSSFYAWLVGAAVILIIALILSEIATLHPKRGLFTRILTLSHNGDVGYITALANWLGMVVVIPVESFATIQYLSTANPAWTQHLYSQDQLTALGLFLAIIILILYLLLNFWGIKLLSKSNNIITLVKIVVPILTGVAILAVSYHPGNLSSSYLTSSSKDLSGVLTAVMTGGVILAFNGFQTITSFSAEAKNPKTNIPRACIFAITFCLAVYLLLQSAFILGMPPEKLKEGWAHLDLTSPLAQLTEFLGLNFIAIILYADAAISPSGTGIIFVGSTTRMLHAMSQEQQAPSFFNVTHPKYHLSRRALIFNFLIAVLFALFFKSWEALVTVVSALHVISYMACPIALMRLRIVEKYRERKFRIWLAPVLCPAIFFVINLLYLSTPEVDLIAIAAIMTVFYIGYIFTLHQMSWNKIKQSLKRSYLVPGYLILCSIIGLFGNPKDVIEPVMSPVAYDVVGSIFAMGLYFWLVYFYKYSRRLVQYQP